MVVTEQVNTEVPELLVMAATGDALTVIVPVAFALPHPPVSGML